MKFVWKYFLVVIFSDISFVNGNGQLSCPMPPKFKTNYDFNWHLKSNEWTNNKSPTDFFIFDLSWSPTYCSYLPSFISEKEFQCSRLDSFGLVVHGLWPQTSGASSYKDHPRNCRNDQQIPITVIRRFYCLMPDEDLIQAEWEKHGSCYFQTPLDYFNTIETLYNQLQIPDIRSIKRPTVTSIKNAFLQLNSPKLFSSAILVQINDEGQLKEIRICYDLRYQFVNCRQ